MADKSSIVAGVREYLLEPDMSKPLNAIDTLRIHAGGEDGFFGRDEAETILEYLETLLQENDRLRRENEHFTKSGIIEVAVRNISVSDYMNHWEGRALAAESKLSALTLKDDPGNGAAETRAAALEEAAKLIQATADEHSTKGRDLRGGYSDRRFYAVMGARLNESAAAIRALIPERER